MHVMVRGAAPEREPAVHRERHIVTDVCLHAGDDREHLEPDLSERVTTDDPWRCGGEHPHRDELPGVQVLRHPAARAAVLVMQTMHMAVQPANLVVSGMPDEILNVENGQSRERLPDELP